MVRDCGRQQRCYTPQPAPRVMTRFELVRKPALTLLLLLGVGAIGWLDYLTGPDVGFSLFYLVPIVAAGWFLGVLPAALVSVMAAAAWFYADLAWQEPAMAAISRWNGFTRLVIYVGIGWLVALARKDRDRLSMLNLDLATALGRETHLARTDALTQLGNTRRFVERLDEELRKSRTLHVPLSLAYIDIDNFKKVNDAYGHNAGDELLRRIAFAIGNGIRAGDLAARVGGDEFALLLRGVTPEEAGSIAERIGASIRREGVSFPDAGVAASIGIVAFSSPPDSADAAMRAADQAMYAAKLSGGGSVNCVVL